MAPRQPQRQQRVVKQKPGMIAGEGAAGPVGAFQPGGKADDGDARQRIAKAGDGRVEPVRMERAVGHPVGNQPRAQRTCGRGLKHGLEG